MLTQLGIPKLWDEDPERFWPFLRRCVPPATRMICPSYAYGSDRVPRAGGAVIAANHFEAVDPVLIGIHSVRAIYYMAKIELLSTPLIGEILRWGGTFAVRRGASDRDAIRVARWVVNEGHMVGVFMEGTRQALGYPGPAHPGAAMIAMQEQVPVVPVGVDTFRWSIRNRRPCAVVWGEPLLLDGLPRTGKGYREGTALLEAEVTRLWRIATEAVALGFPLELPDGSQRSRSLPPRSASVATGLRAWPDEPWAKGPLGPVYRGRRTPSEGQMAAV